jgi:hypothetical protein
VHGPEEVVELVVSWAVTTALLFLVVIVDERRMTEQRRERAWPASSRDAAIVAFGLFALPVHFARTRGDFRSARGVFERVLGMGLGIVLAGLVTAADGLVIWALDALLGVPS